MSIFRSDGFYFRVELEVQCCFQPRKCNKNALFAMRVSGQWDSSLCFKGFYRNTVQRAGILKHSSTLRNTHTHKHEPSLPLALMHFCLVVIILSSLSSMTLGIKLSPLHQQRRQTPDPAGPVLPGFPPQIITFQKEAFAFLCQLEAFLFEHVGPPTAQLVPTTPERWGGQGRLPGAFSVPTSKTWETDEVNIKQQSVLSRSD